MNTSQNAADTAAQQNWDRYRYGIERGHLAYIQRATLCERFYLGGGLQWDDADRAILESEGRPALEANEVMPALNSAIGYQIHNRMDISFRPRKAASQASADIRSKLAMQIADNNKLHWVETGVFSDGMIEQRGYFDVRMDYQTNVHGELVITDLDPRDVIPDPDAKSYDPSKWADVIVTRWYSLDEIEALYGRKIRDLVEKTHGADGEQDFGDGADDGGDDGERNKFGDNNTGSQSYYAWFRGSLKDSTARYRIVDRQRFTYEMADVVITQYGDVHVVTETNKDAIAAEVAAGGVMSKRMTKRVKWTVTTRYVTLFDEIGPYDRFTVVPFFPYFRRGKTRGMVDNAIDPQKILNKGLSQFVHILNSSANSGWTVEEQSLSNMTTEDLEERGAENGLVIEHKKGTQAPKKIEPNQVPNGVDRLMDRALLTLKEVTVPDAMRGSQGAEVSGVAIQSRQSASQQQLAVPLDGLSRTRAFLSSWIDYSIMHFYDAPRIVRITETNPDTGTEEHQFVEINQPDGQGGYINDMSTGEYDSVVTEQPMQVTFENGQFTQALEMRKSGVNIPDSAIVMSSNLSKKQEVIKQMEGMGGKSPEETALAEATTAKLVAEKGLVEATTVNKLVESTFSAMQAARVIAETPQTAGMADSLLKSAGFKDQDAAPIVPDATGIPAPAVGPTPNTNPLTPANPGVGLDAGIEGGGGA
ncbi:MAG: hypothetical protein WA085_12630 [Sphingobium sp.]